ncbi:MAG: hypothetical protein ACJAX4_001602, partial [Clostridium sp.]
MATMDVRIISGNLPFHVSQDLCPNFLRSVYPRGGCQYVLLDRVYALMENFKP